jgi:hypothetical protein
VSTDPARRPDPNLLKTLARAHEWFRILRSGQATSIKEIADSEHIDARHVARTLRLAFLAPDITRRIVEGREPQGLTADRLLKLPALPHDWHVQRELLGFSAT